MDKSAIKTYAVEARRKLIEAVRQKAYQLHIFEDGVLPPDEAYQRLRADGIFLTPEQNSARLRLCNELAAIGHDLNNKAAYQHLIENVACTWFNRLIALRIMEVNDWLPSNIRILSSREPGRIEPDAVREVERLDYLNQTKVAELRADTDINAAEKLYKYILISKCNALSAILPGMFQRENDYTELLLPDALLAKGGIVNDLVSKIHEDNFNVEKQGQIEIIGWLYQFYISEKKDEVFAGLKKNIKINKDTIPAATQLFTPEWIVKYMVENSLGRLWLDTHPNADLRAKWKYYIDEAEQEPEVAEQLRVLRSQSPIKRPEDIKLIDPCMGSGHILVYAFDVLFQIYQSEGYSEREIPNLILQNNIYGLDIDDRAGQLAYFALMIKARSYNRRFFRQDNIPQPMVYACAGDDGKEYGSLIKPDMSQDYTQPPVIAEGQLSLDDMQHEAKLAAWNMNRLLTQKYDVVVTNPPYMAPAPSQADWIKKHYPDSKSDLCVVFIERNFDLLKQNGYLSMITMHSWMFLSSYEKFRQKLIASRDIVNMAHLGARAFEEIGGEVVQTTAFTTRGSDVPGYLGTYARLVNFNSQQAKEDAFLAGGNRHTAKKENFEKIPGWPVAYWVSKSLIQAFIQGKQLNTVSDVRKGLTTSNNDKYLRVWYEVLFDSICFLTSESSLENTYHKWFKTHKGGEYHRWYGNNETVINWANNGQEIKSFPNAVIRNPDYYFKECITWTDVSFSKTSFRYTEQGSISNASGPSIYYNGKLDILYIIALCNSLVAEKIYRILCPTIHFEVGQVAGFPVVIDSEKIQRVISLTNDCIAISRTDWDSFETSWDFKAHPLIQYKIMAGFEDSGVGIYSGTAEQAFKWWKQNAERQFNKLKANEEELNRIFIDIYGLQDELTPEVEDKDVTIRKADLGRDIRSFISYAVGCMFGRYSLDEPGLVFAGGKFDIAKYKTFVPEDDNILPIGSADYFDDDIVIRFIEFVRVVYGDNTLGENLSFIADALYPNGNGSPQDKIRRYFLNDFYKDHVKIYQKRPIYWLLDSGKKDGFKALFYLHRYDKYTVARARTDYLHPLQRKYDAEIKRLEMLSGSTEDVREKAAYRKEIDALLAKIDECRVYDQVVSHIAHQQIELDLDDGVKVNYEKFQGVEVPKDNGRSETMDLLGKI